MAITPPKALVPAAVLVWSGLAVAALLARQGETIIFSATNEDEKIIEERSERFQTRWDDATLADQPLLKKQDRLPLATVADVAVAERITPPAPDAPVGVPPVIVMQDDDDKPPAARHRRHRKSEPGHSHSESNVCTRHRMHKVAVRSGRSWRCRK
jgi:hypothetical protein